LNKEGCLTGIIANIVSRDRATINHYYNEQVFKLCLLGATEKDIAGFFNIAESTLKNRQPELWRDKQIQEHTGKDGKNLFAGLTDDELILNRYHVI